MGMLPRPSSNSFGGECFGSIKRLAALVPPWFCSTTSSHQPPRGRLRRQKPVVHVRQKNQGMTRLASWICIHVYYQPTFLARAITQLRGEMKYVKVQSSFFYKK